MKNKESNFVSLVVYVYNSEKTIKQFLDVIDKEFSNYFGKYEIICVNDASIDDSERNIRMSAENIQAAVSIINMGYHQGLEASMNAGVDLAIGDFVYEMDSTVMDYPVGLVKETYKKALEGYDIVTVGPEKNNLVSGFFYRLYNKVTGTQNKLRTESFRILSRRAINRIYILNKTVPYRKAVYANCGLNMYAFSYIPKEKVKHKQAGKMEIAVTSLVLFSNIAYKVSLSFAMVMAIGTIGAGVYALCNYFGGRKPVEGWTTTILLLAFGFCAVFVLFAIVIKYLSIILNMIFKKQNYLIDSIEKIGK